MPEAFEAEYVYRLLEELGLSITPHSDPSYGWGFTWRGDAWYGPYDTKPEALKAAFERAITTITTHRNCPFEVDKP